MKLSTIEVTLPAEQVESIRTLAQRAGVTVDHIASLLCVVGLQHAARANDTLAIVILINNDSTPSRTDAEDGDVRT